jgi:hypothetical protein
MGSTAGGDERSGARRASAAAAAARRGKSERSQANMTTQVSEAGALS